MGKNAFQCSVMSLQCLNESKEEMHRWKVR